MLRKFAVVLLCLVMGAAFFWSDSRKTPGDTYTVAVTYLPKRLDPRRNQINVYYYMILQLYEPLLRIDAGKVQSAFLEVGRTRSLARSFDSYQLCLRSDARFSDGTPVQAGDLASSLRAAYSVQETYPPLVAIKTEGDCVDVQLGRRDPHYLDKLTTTASTVLKRGTEEEPIPTGLGPYTIDAWDDRHVHMTFHGTDPHVDFQHIDFVLVQDLEEALERDLMDLNLMYWEPHRSQVLAQWPRLHHPMMRSYVLIVSTPNADLRKKITSCFDRSRYLNEAMSLDLLPAHGFLHPRSPGSGVDFDEIQSNMRRTECRFDGVKPKLRYINQVYADHDALQRFFQKEAEHLPVEIVVEDRHRSELIDMFGEPEAMIFAVGMDSVNSQAADLGDRSVFFESILRDKRVIPELLGGVQKAVVAAASTGDRQKKADHYTEAHRALLASGYVIPLGYLPPVLFYPPSIKQVEFADSVIGYPRVDWIKVHPRWWP